VRCWQARQWQMEMRTGSFARVRRSWPQEHIALRVVRADPPSSPQVRNEAVADLLRILLVAG
jgi:hypothetical protein